jgi:hypothetical protein
MIILIFFLIFIGGCTSVTSHYVIIEKNFLEKKYEEAEKVIEETKDKYTDINALLYFMDRGMITHLSKKYKESNMYLLRAEEISEELYTKSISSEIGAMLTNDNTLPYEGEDYEKVMLNIIMMMNYTLLNDIDEALVEARKVDNKLNLFNDKYEHKNVYKNDAFARYICGILYEMKNQYDDALIEYRKSYEAFKDYEKYYGTKPPLFLIKDMLRLTDKLNFKDEHEKLKKEYPNIEWISQNEMKNKSEIIVIAYIGLSPIKEDYFVDVYLPKEKDIIRVAFPKFVERKSIISHVDIEIDRKIYSSSLFENISAIAKKNLEDRIARIYAKAVARATTKYIAAKEIKKEAKKKEIPILSALVSFITDVYKVATEESDKRSWRTLPNNIQLARILIEPGKYSIKVKFMRGKEIIEENELEIDAIPNQKKFLIFHCSK